MSDSWQKVGKTPDFQNRIECIEVGDRKVAVTMLQGELYAFDGFCPHVYGPMHRSEINGTILTCPLHGWRFDLRDGGREIHNYKSLPMHETKIEGEDVYVRIADGKL
jgi:nitrite reductase (NADH) small subunit